MEIPFFPVILNMYHYFSPDQGNINVLSANYGMQIMLVCKEQTVMYKLYIIKKSIILPSTQKTVSLERVIITLQFLQQTPYAH